MISGAAVQINHCWTVLGRIEMPNSILVPAWKSLHSNIWNVKPILQSLMVLFFSLKDFSPPKSIIHFCHHVYASGFLKLDCTSSLLPHTDEETVTHVNEVSISAGSFGIRESTNRGWRYRCGKTISFRWFNKRSAVCIATGIAMLDCISLIEIVVPLV